MKSKITFRNQRDLTEDGYGALAGRKWDVYCTERNTYMNTYPKKHIIGAVQTFNVEKGKTHYTAYSCFTNKTKMCDSRQEAGLWIYRQHLKWAIDGLVDMLSQAQD